MMIRNKVNKSKKKKSEKEKKEIREAARNTMLDREKNKTIVTK